MTFDIMGIKPHNELGEYLSFNNVSWHPLWDAMCRNTPELTPDDREKGSMNDCHVIQGDKLFGIIRALNQMMARGNRFGIDDITWENLRMMLIFCESVEGFRIC